VIFVNDVEDDLQILSVSAQGFRQGWLNLVLKSRTGNHSDLGVGSSSQQHAYYLNLFSQFNLSDV